MEQDFNNHYNLDAMRAFFKRWRNVLIIVFVAALIVSGLVAFLTTPLFKSTATLFPSNSNRLSKAIMDYHYSLDFMDYGGEPDCERAIEILESRSMMVAVADHFNLMEHYEIKPDSEHKMFELSKKFANRVTIKRTDNIGVRVSVVDKDPQMAADMANYMVAMFDTLCHAIHHERAESADEVMQKVCARMEREIDSLSQIAAGKPWMQQLIEYKTKELSNLQTRATETSVDKTLAVSYIYKIDRAVPADKKDSPKRLLVMATGSIGALVVAIFCLLIFAPRKEE